MNVVYRVISEKSSIYFRVCRDDKMKVRLSKSGTLGTPAIVKTDDKLGLFESLAVLKYDRLPDSICEKYFSGMSTVQMAEVVAQALEAWFSGKPSWRR